MVARKEGKKMEEKARIPKKEEKIEQKKEDVKINKTRHRQNIYVKAIGMIKQVNTICYSWCTYEYYH